MKVRNFPKFSPTLALLLILPLLPIILNKFFNLGPSELLALVWWYLLLDILGLLLIPMINFFLPGLPDMGYGISKVLGLLVLGYTNWLLCLSGLPMAGTPCLILTLLILALASLAMIKMLKIGEVLTAA